MDYSFEINMIFQKWFYLMLIIVHWQHYHGESFWIKNAGYAAGKNTSHSNAVFVEKLSARITDFLSNMPVKDLRITGRIEINMDANTIQEATVIAVET